MFYNNYFYYLSFLIFLTEAVKEPDLPRADSIAQSECSNITQYDKLYDGYCYELVTNLRYSWHEASSYCRSNGAELVSIHSNEEESVVKKLKNMRNTDVDIWIGLHLSCFDHKFEWSDGTPLVISKMWSFHTPCGFHYKNSDLSYTSETCFSIDAEGLWHMKYCSETNNFICKRKVDSAGQDLSTLTPHVFQPGKCKTDWNSFGDYCYLLVGQKENDWLDFGNANEACALLNGSLASVIDKKEQVFLTYLLQNINYDVWIGFRKNIITGAFSWTDNSSVTYTHWADLEPNYYDEEEECVSMLHSPKERGFWNDYYCSEKFPYICKAKKDPIINTNSTPLSANCAGLKDWLGQGHSCFKFFSENKTWNEAEEFCEKFGAKLITITDVIVQSTFKYLSVDTNVSIWIGLSQNLSRSFEWINGFPMTISYWDKNQPAPKEKNDTCIMSSSEGFWNISPCHISRPFICRTSENGKDIPSREVTYSKTCANRRFIEIDEEDDYCYRIMMNMPQEATNEECSNIGSQISSFHSLHQVENLKTYLKQNGHHLTNFTVGLSRNQRGGFTWLDHTPFDFEYWDENEPKDSNAFCFEMDAETLKWRTTECKVHVNVICSVKKKIIEFWRPRHVPRIFPYVPIPLPTTRETKEVTSTTRNPSNSASEIHQFTTQQIYYTTETKEVTSSTSITSNANSEIQQFTTQPTNSTTNAEESSSNSRSSIASFATSKFPQTTTETIHSISNAEKTTSSSSISSDIVPEMHQLSTESSISTYELYNPTSNASVTSNVIDKIYTLPSKTSHSTHESTHFPFSDDTSFTTTAKNLQSSTEYTLDTYDSKTSTSISATTLVGILVFIFLMVAAISGTYFYFKPHLRKRSRNFFSNGNASESVLYGVNTGLLIQKNEDKERLILASSTL